MQFSELRTVSMYTKNVYFGGYTRAEQNFSWTLWPVEPTVDFVRDSRLDSAPHRRGEHEHAPAFRFRRLSIFTNAFRALLTKFNGLYVFCLTGIASTYMFRQMDKISDITRGTVLKNVSFASLSTPSGLLINKIIANVQGIIRFELYDRFCPVWLIS